MNNLFKKGFASLALASAMTSSIFAGNAAYIDIKVNYLGEKIVDGKTVDGTDVAVLGYDTTATSGDGREKVELLVSVLDKDGNYATKNSDGGSLGSVVYGELDSAADDAVDGVPNTTENNVTGLRLTVSGIVVSPLSRDLKGNDNIDRFILDYTNYTTEKLEDEVSMVLGAGSAKLERKITIKLGSVDAEGLLVRATPNSTFKTEKYINAMFEDINVTGEANELNVSSSKAPGGLVGISIPIQVYASTMSQNTSVNGKFTFAPNLEDKIIVVQALADYNETNVTRTVLNSIEIPMKNGQASGNIVITNGLPAGVDGGNVVNPLNDDAFEPALSEGLGIAFLVYVKDEIAINNYPDLTDATPANNYIKSGKFDSNMTAWGRSTDTIQVKSGEPAELKVGKLDVTARKISKLWTGTSSIIVIADGNDTSIAADGNLLGDINDSHTDARTLTVVDSYGNPAIISGTITTKVRFGSDTTNKFVKVTSGDVAVARGISTIAVNIFDSEDTNNTTSIKPVKFTVDASNGMLAALDPISLTAKALPLIEYNVDGGSVWKKAIVDVNTTAGFTQIANYPLVATATNVLKVTENDFTVVIKSGVGDGNLSDQNSTFRVFIIDKSGDSDSGYLESSDLTKYTFSLTNFQDTMALAPINMFTTAAVPVGGRVDKISEGYVRYDYNSSGPSDGNATPASDVNFTLSVIKGSVVLARIEVENYNASKNEEEVVIKIPTFEDQKISAFVEVYAGDIDLTEVKPGTIVNFKFTGAAVSTGDKIEIDMNASNYNMLNGKTNEVARIGLVGSEMSDNTNGKIETTLPENGIVSVVLYDVNVTDDTTYGFKVWNGTSNNESSVLINGIRPVWLYLRDNGDTDDIKELNTSDTFKMVRLDDNDITKVRVTVVSNGDGDGTADDKRKSLPQTKSASSTAINLGNKLTPAVLTGVYYDIFVETTSDVIFLDKYDNEVSGLKDDIKKDVTFTHTDGIEFDNDGSDSYIKFKEAAAGTKQTLTVSYVKDDKSVVSNTITWNKITLNKKNSGFIITNDANGFVDPNTGLFSVENSEIIVKIIGNGNTPQSATKITVTHDNKDAKVRLTKVNGITGDNAYDNSLSGLDSSIKESIAATGNYYIVSASKAGTVTIKVDSKVKDSKDNDVAITASHTITFDAVDLDNPMVIESGVVASGSTITVEVTDKNLDTVKTLVTVSDINDNSKSIVKAVYTNGKYVAQVSSAGIYQVEILGVDMAGNSQRFNYARTVGEGSATLEDALVAHGSYAIDGTFAPYDFKDVDSSFDWVYTQGTTMNQLNAKGGSEDTPFKWGPVTDITPGTKNVWYMIQLTGTAGTADALSAYGWVLVNAKGDTFKLVGANKDGTFMFSKALYVKGTMSGSNISFAKR